MSTRMMELLSINYRLLGDLGVSILEVESTKLMLLIFNSLPENY